MWPSQAYWKKQAENTLLMAEKSEQAFEFDMQKAFGFTQVQIDLELKKFYKKYATEEGITLAEAEVVLKPSEQQSFKAAAKKYLDYVEAHKDEMFDPKIAAQIKALSRRAHISRLEELQFNIGQKVDQLTNFIGIGMQDTLKAGYQDSFYATAFNVSKQVGMSASFTFPSDKQLTAAVQQNWLGRNFSDSLWKNQDKLKQQLERLMPLEFVRGKGSKDVARKLSEAMSVGYNDCVRLVRTEMNYTANQGTLSAYDESKVKYYEYLATLDKRTSEICRELDGQTKMPVSEAQVGTNYPPMHPYCRSTTIPWFPDDEISATVTQRVARNADGKSYTIDANPTFQQWVDNYADGAYAKSVKKNPGKYSALPLKPFSLMGMSAFEYKEFLEQPVEDWPVGKYTEDEILKGIIEKEMDEFGIEDVDAHKKFSVRKAAVKLGYADSASALLEQPFLIDMKLNNVTEKQAWNKVIFGTHENSIYKAIVNNPALAVTALNNLSNRMHKYTIAISPEKLAYTLEEIHSALTHDVKKTFFDHASGKNADYNYEKAYKAFKAAYGIVGVPAASLSKVVKGKYDTIEEAKAAHDATFAKVKQNAEAKKAAGIAPTTKKSSAKTPATAPPAQNLPPTNMDLAELDKLSRATPFPQGRRTIDATYRKWTAALWHSYTKAEQKAAYTYTYGSGKFNRPLAGYSNSWGTYKPEVDLDKEGGKEDIINLYKMIDKSPIPETIKVRRGGTLDEVTNRKSGLFKNLLPANTSGYTSNMDDTRDMLQNPDKYIGQVVNVPNFLSTGVAKDAGFGGSQLEYRIILPAGTKATYAEPYSHYGSQPKSGGMSTYGGEEIAQYSIDSEAEIIVQAGTSYIVTKVLKNKDTGGLFIEMMAIPESQNIPPDKLKPEL